jgi:putative NIF3 family GTP cyclohydrolase 1 type 2
MRLGEIVAELDAFFRLETFQPDLPFSRLVPGVYERTGIKLDQYLERTFLERFHGLMIRNGHEVDRIYSTVFLSDEIVQKVLSGGGRRALLISHHPLVMETSQRGFLPLSEACFAGMRDRGISVYVLHTPLDVHGQVSTSRALARELGVEERGGYHLGPGGYAGLYGRLPVPLAFGDLLARVRDVTGVPDLHYIERGRSVRTMAVLGGGTDVDGIREAMALGCDVLVTGTYYNQVQTEIGQRYRDEFERIRDTLSISLVECSHYASEAVVMRKDLLKLCAERFGVACDFVPQEDPWY